MAHPGSKSLEEENKMLSSNWKKTKCTNIEIISYNNL